MSELTAVAKAPGIQYVVVNAAGVLFEHHAGWADIKHHVSVDAATTMMAYSMSKTMTAVAVLQLVEAGKVGLDDSVDRYTDVSPYGAGVTVRQLIAHTSGIPNPIPLQWVHPAARHGAFDERAALAAIVRKHPRLSFAPGAKYAYSNIGYWLLGLVVERASGQSFHSYVTTHILQPLGILPRELGYEVTEPAHHATGYLEKWSFVNLIKGFFIDRGLIGEYAGSWLEIKPHYLNGPAFGGLVGTAGGFAKFLRDQLGSESVLLRHTTRQLLDAPQQTTNGRTIAMTLGWHVGELNGARYLFKEGGGGGFHCMMRVYPTRGIGSVVMTNATMSNVRAAMDRVDPRFLQAAG